MKPKKKIALAAVIACVCVAAVAALLWSPWSSDNGESDVKMNGQTGRSSDNGGLDVRMSEQPARGDDSGGSDANEVHIGLLAPLTGHRTLHGVSAQQGAMLYIDAFNARGGLQIKVTTHDDEDNPALAVAIYRDLVDQGVIAILGPLLSGPTRAVVPDAFADGMPMISVMALHAGVTVNLDTGGVFTNMFRASFIDHFQGTKMADFAVEELSARTAAILYAHDIGYSIELMEAFVARADEIGLEIVRMESFADGDVDFTAQLMNIAVARPDVLFVPTYFRQMSLIGPQSVAAGVAATLIGADGWEGILEVIADPSSLEGAFYMTRFTYESDEPHIVDFITRFEAEYGSMPSMVAAHAYDAAAILIGALERAIADGYTPGSDEFKRSVISHMAATDLNGVTGRITFDRLNNPQKTAFITRIEGGEAKLWGTF
jgi:branched-chain amino acid transport system substrate-binding protein